MILLFALLVVAGVYLLAWAFVGLLYVAAFAIAAGAVVFMLIVDGIGWLFGVLPDHWRKRHL